ncbi:hypothetical protein Nmel_003253 [Mimus melanotis]
MFVRMRNKSRCCEFYSGTLPALGTFLKNVTCFTTIFLQ